jgi:NitT/TauT family transport system ATP-binding protein
MEKKEAWFFLTSRLQFEYMEKKIQLNLENITHEYASKGSSQKTHLALSNINLKVHENEFVCLVGPSGCGKSTILNIMASLQQPTKGHVSVENKKVKKPGPDRSVVFQESALFPWLTVFQNVAFGLELKDYSKKYIKEKVFLYLEKVGLANFSDSYVHELSGGMRQRVAIARSLVMNPKVLLMDEPFAALDAQTRDTLHEELQSLWMKEKKSVVFVTHNVREAVCLADRLFLLSTSPGTIKKEYKINLPRIRTVYNSKVVEIASEVLRDLKDLKENTRCVA